MFRLTFSTVKRKWVFHFYVPVGSEEVITRERWPLWALYRSFFVKSRILEVGTPNGRKGRNFLEYPFRIHGWLQIWKILSFDLGWKESCDWNTIISGVFVCLFLIKAPKMPVNIFKMFLWGVYRLKNVWNIRNNFFLTFFFSFHSKPTAKFVQIKVFQFVKRSSLFMGRDSESASLPLN